VLYRSNSLLLKTPSAASVASSVAQRFSSDLKLNLHSVGSCTCSATIRSWPTASGKSAKARDAGPPLDAEDHDPDLTFFDDDLAAGEPHTVAARSAPARGRSGGVTLGSPQTA
jgi:hypothetical protein